MNIIARQAKKKEITIKEGQAGRRIGGQRWHIRKHIYGVFLFTIFLFKTSLFKPPILRHKYIYLQ